MFLVDFLGSSTFLWWQDLQWKWSLGGHFPSIRNTWIWQNPVCCFEGQNSDLLGLLDFFYGRPVSPFACTVLAKQSSWHRPSQRASHLAIFFKLLPFFWFQGFWFRSFFQKSSVEPAIERSHSRGFRSSALLVGTCWNRFPFDQV